MSKKIVLGTVCLFALNLISFASAAGGGSMIPMNAKDTGSARIVGVTGTVLHTVDTGRGQATHLGLYTLAATQDIDVVTGTVTNGAFTLTAASGDTVSGSYSGQALPGLVGYTVSGPITGGTGRFAGAMGFLVWNGTVDPLALTFTDEIVGTISSTGGR